MKTMHDMIIIRGVPALVVLDVETFVVRGEFVGLSELVSFQAPRVSELRARGQEALDAFIAECREQDRHPLKRYGDNNEHYVLEDVYAELKVIAEQRGQTLEVFVKEQKPFAYKRKATAFEELMLHQRKMDMRHRNATEAD